MREEEERRRTGMDIWVFSGEIKRRNGRSGLTGRNTGRRKKKKKRISESQGLRISESPNLRISEFQNLNISEFQNLRITEIPKYRYPGIQESSNPRIQKAQNPGNSKFSTLSFPFMKSVYKDMFRISFRF
ncbi:Protein CBG01201 [Caenorhabditis briggsae]|uniref:Protein CBG01201 n=1 Tax=Caenorhabditis briggsae TaxID=6238 RepID=A8WPT9_CAEBR|nr:Protein CBG01201 [Caenorhabditis briggsae]CAP22496.1 Protein CBG01201 [Caenorhabditis briggsae]